MPAAQIWAELQFSLADSNGEAAFARQFARLNPLERIARVQHPARGTLGELNQLLRFILLASPQWDELEGESELYLSVDSSGETRIWEFGRGIPSELETSDFMREYVLALWNYFQPFDHTIVKFLCVRKIGNRPLFARAFRPSAHQQLEAQLRLRDWITAH